VGDQLLKQSSRAQLLDGETISIRRLKRSDTDRLVELYESLTDDECYLRFFTMHPAHLHAWARSLTERSKRQYALGAFSASGKLLGVANYIVGATPDEAEVAVVVAHTEHMRGVGTVLLRRLAEVAKMNGLRRLVAEVLAANHPMLHVMSDAGWPCARQMDGSEVHVVVDLDDIPGDSS
jgi:L-amino acid N-acyltransferase YncA